MKKYIKTIFYSAFGVIFCSISACQKTCKTYTQYETAPVILEYFGNYKPGNYWIYENQDGSKRDSMWVSDYEEGKGGNNYGCFQYPTRQFVLHSLYLGISKELIVTINNGGSCCTSHFRIIDTISSAGLGVSSINFIDLSKAELNDRFVSNVGIRKIYTYNLKDTLFLIKYKIQ